MVGENGWSGLNDHGHEAVILMAMPRNERRPPLSYGESIIVDS